MKSNTQAHCACKYGVVMC